LGGISHESTVKYYELLHQKYYEKHKDYYYPEVVIFSLDLQKLTDFENKKDMQGYVKYIMTGINSLENAGVDFIIIAANSPHSVFEQIKNRSKVPMLSIVEAAAKKAKEKGTKKLLLTGIKFTMQSSFYKEVCKKYGIEVITPKEEEQDIINDIIFDELVIGVFKEETKKKLLDIIESYKVDGVILGCTELPLILKQNDTKVRLLDTLDLHAQTTLDYSLS